jgi:hypothetical protein
MKSWKLFLFLKGSKEEKFSYDGNCEKNRDIPALFD